MNGRKPLTLPNHACVWARHLAPHGDGTFEKEPFPEWWSRNQNELSHLPPEHCEQWIYRHWNHSAFAFLPLETLRWERRTCGGQELLNSIYRAFGGELHPQFDYETFQRRGGDDRHRTATALDNGTWDYPMLLLSTPNGIVDMEQEHRDVRLVIVEGHQRHRYLNALHALGRPPTGPHDVLVLSSPFV